MAARKAPNRAVVILLSRELYTALARLPFLQFIAGTKLIKLYGTLRSDDLRGALTELMRFTPRAFSMNLRRTETTGAAHKVLSIAVYVSREMSISDLDWMAALQEVITMAKLDWTRDYWVPLPCDDLTGAHRYPAEYGDCVAFTHAVFADLRVPRWNPQVQMWEESEELLIAPEMGGFYSQRSPRGGLPTWSTKLGHPKVDRDYLGAWGQMVLWPTHGTVNPSCSIFRNT